MQDDLFKVTKFVFGNIYYEYNLNILYEISNDKKIICYNIILFLLIFEKWEKNTITSFIFCFYCAKLILVCSRSIYLSVWYTNILISKI